jgi:hypothetical protein
MSSKKPQEAVSGSYTPLPHALVDSVAYMGASDRAKAMLIELIRQHNARNNGHLHLAIGWLRKRGWTSTRAIQLAKAELLARGLAKLTRRGGLNAGPDRYALTWLPISNYAGLDIRPGDYAPGAWRFADPPPVMSARQPPPPATRTKKRKPRSDSENSAIPVLGTASTLTVPVVRTKRAIIAAPTVLTPGNNEVTSSLPISVRRHGTPGAPPRIHADPWAKFCKARRFSPPYRLAVINHYDNWCLSAMPDSHEKRARKGTQHEPA